MTLGFAAQLRGEYEEGEQSTSEALQTLGDSVDAWLSHAGHRLLGVLHTGRENNAAKAELERALGIARQMGFQVDEVETLARIGRLHRLQGDLEGAINAFENSILLSREAGTTPFVDRVRSQVAAIYRYLDDHDRARAALNLGPNVLEAQLGRNLLPAHLLVQLGALALEEGQLGESRSMLELAVTRADEEGDRVQRVLARDALARLRLAEGDNTEADATRDSADQLAEEAKPFLAPAERVDSFAINLIRSEYQ
jgi:tetratricopeptide (TPR) repeat protein